MNVNEFISKLRRYKGNDALQISINEADRFIRKLALPKPVITIEIMDKLFPDWKTISTLNMVFTYQINFGGVYLSICAETYNKKEEEYEVIDALLLDKDEELYTEITERMENMLDGPNDFTEEMCKDLFDEELLNMFYKH